MIESDLHNNRVHGIHSRFEVPQPGGRYLDVIDLRRDPLVSRKDRVQDSGIDSRKEISLVDQFRKRLGKIGRRDMGQVGTGVRRDNVGYRIARPPGTSNSRSRHRCRRRIALTRSRKRGWLAPSVKETASISWVSKHTDATTSNGAGNPSTEESAMSQAVCQPPPEWAVDLAPSSPGGAQHRSRRCRRADTLVFGRGTVAARCCLLERRRRDRPDALLEKHLPIDECQIVAVPGAQHTQSIVRRTATADQPARDFPTVWTEQFPAVATSFIPRNILRQDTVHLRTQFYLTSAAWGSQQDAP